MANFGNLGNVSPQAMAAVRRALQRRQQGMPTAALNQASQVSASPAPLPPPNVPKPNTGLPGTPPQVSGGEPLGSPEAQIILKAMSDRLKSENKIREAASTPEPDPMQLFMMGGAR